MALTVFVRLYRVRVAMVCAAFVLASAADVAEAVIVAGSSVTNNRFDPSGGSPIWTNVGERGIGSGVYLGNSWVLTANHVGGGSITLNDGNTYQMAADSGTQLVNPTSLSPTDLYLFKLTADPGLPWLKIATETNVYDTVFMIGAGMTRGNETFWSIDTNSNPSKWNAITSGTADAHGYALETQRTMGWGLNVIQAKGSVTVDTTLVEAAFGTTFYEGLFAPPFNGYEGQASTGDSGGAVFRRGSADWELAGIMVGVTPSLSGQPASALLNYGSPYYSSTYMADLSVYRDQIVAITAVPEPGAFVLAAIGAGALGLSGVVRRFRLAKGS